MNPAIKAKCKSFRKRQEFCLDMDIPSCFASFIEDPTEEPQLYHHFETYGETSVAATVYDHFEQQEANQKELA
jgi:hypothetical protein